ncbi:MAG: hypothetical protein NVS1B14_08710 [Vulcanimicrobiaceae bacterium]
MDLGIVNGTYFANFATIGVLAQIGLETPKLLKRVAGPIAYGISTIVPALKSRAFTANIEWEKNTLRLSTRQIIVANGRYFGVTPVLPDATITDGRLTFFATDDMSRADIFKSGIAFLQGTQTALHNAHYFHTKRLTIRTKGRQVIAIDGSWLGKTPAKFSVAPKALQVMVPPSFPTDA